MIKTDQITKIFKLGKKNPPITAVEDLTLEVKEGEVFGFLGPNGAGKTTFAREFLPNEAECPQFINADLIAAGLSPFAPDLAAVKAARLMLENIT